MKKKLQGTTPGAISRRTLLQGSSAVVMVGWMARLGATSAGHPRDPAIERLIARMTLEEKAGQLSLFTGKGPGRSVNPVKGNESSLNDIEAEVRAGRAMGYFNSFNPYLAQRLQKVAVQESRLGIPLVFAADVIHGFRTGFPVPLGEAASFDADLCTRTARMTAVEATAHGLHWTFAPMVDVARDQRWGRVVEGSGEDPWLGKLLAAARVRGFQGNDLAADDALLACPKHFAAYGAVEGGMEYNTVEISEAALREIHLPPFKAALDAGALSIMAAFNDIGGVPSSGNPRLLTGILRDEWRFRGLVVSDFESEGELVAHGFAADEADAVVKAISAGCDVSMQSGLYNKHLPALVRSGRLQERVVDEAVRRVLGVKKALGLFANPYRSIDPSRPTEISQRADATPLAREAGRKSIVMLKNDGDLLPLQKAGKRISFIGPFVSDKVHALGPWMVFPDTTKTVSLEDGVRAALGADATVTFTKGSNVDTELEGGIAAATAAAAAADIVVAYVGESAAMSGEAASRTAITLPAVQQSLVEAVAKTGKPLVVLLKHGRALELEGAVARASAILCTWFLGSESGNAIADLLFGDHSPQGRLPVSFPQRSGQEPYYYDHRSTGRAQSGQASAFKSRYREVNHAAAYPFGFGLGYARVTYGATTASAPVLPKSGQLTVSALIRNEGTRRQHEVAQLYIHVRVAQVTQPVRALKAVKHLDLDPGESRRVEFELTVSELGYVHQDNGFRADSGTFDVWIAGSATEGEPATVSLS